MEHLLFAFNVLAPLLLLALLGAFLRMTKLIEKPFVDQLNGFIFKIALPVMIFHTLSSTDEFASIDVGVFLFVVIASLLIAVIGFLIIHFQPWHVQVKPVVLQSLFRGNYVIIGIPLALRLGGQEALSVLIVLNAMMIPLTNLLSFTTFSVFHDGSYARPKLISVVYKTFVNPIMVAVYLGLIAYGLSDIYKPITESYALIPDTLSMIQATVTPMALIAIGAQFELKRVQSLKSVLIFAVIARMVFIPLIVFTAAYLLRHTIDFSQSWIALVALFASPVAVASVAVTKGLNGDDSLASQLVILDTGMAVFTVFAAIIWLRTMGFI